MTEFFSFLIAGIVFGAIYAVSASGLVVTYNTTGIFNFAHGAMGMVMAYLFWQLWQGWGLPELVSLAIVLFVAAPVLGVVVERVVMRPLYGAATSIRLAVTLGLLLVLVALAGTIWSPTANTYNTPEFLNGNPISIAGITLSWEQLITVAVAMAVAMFLRVFFRRTRTGVAMRAVVDDPSLASLAGAPSGRISAYAWMIGVMFAGLGGILLAPSVQGMNIETLTQLVIYGYAAAVVGPPAQPAHDVPRRHDPGRRQLHGHRLRAAGRAQRRGRGTPHDHAVPGLAVHPRGAPGHRARGAGARRRASPVPGRRSSAAARWWSVVIALGAVLNGNNLYTMGNALALSLLALSLVPLSGYAGQVSLCQFTFLGIGAVTMHAVDGGGSVLGLLAAVGVCAGVGAVLALPVLRLRGLVSGPRHPGLRRAHGQHLLPVELDHGCGWHRERRTPRHLRHALRHRPRLRRVPGRRPGPVPHRRGGAAPRALRPPARGHERLTGGVQHRRAEPHLHEARRVRLLGRARRVWPARSTGV